MAKILVAASPEPRAVLQRILAGHDVCCAESLAHAEKLLSERAFDQIICTVVFDESRMFDLLRIAKSSSQWRSIPFVCARIRADVIKSQAAIDATELTARELGAVAFLDIARFPTDPEGQMRQAIDRLLDEETKSIA